MNKENKLLWELLVPKYSNEGIEYKVAYHNEWDERVREITGGLTISKTVKGHYVSPESGTTYVEEMIRVRIHCTESEIEKIARKTISHYDQEAVMAYVLSEKVKIIKK